MRAPWLCASETTAASALEANVVARPTAPGIGALVRYFLGLGALGFGGPIALSGRMQSELVEERHWFTKEDYVQGLALAQVAPGPLAAQLAIYLGWLGRGVGGATLVAIAFVLPSFLIVLALSALYVHYGELAWMRAAFYGIGPAVIAVIARSSFKLVRMATARDPLLWGILIANALLTAVTGRERVWAVVLSGALTFAMTKSRRSVGAATTLGLVAPWLLRGLHGPATWPTVARIATFFGEAGLVVFGSGLAIVPFLHGGVVEKLHWLSDRQFLDAVAVAMITPGPVVITVAFIGFLVAGLYGALAAALGVFVPCYLFVIVLAPQYRRHAENRSLKALVNGVTAAACGAIAGAAFVLGRRSIVDGATLSIFIVAMALLLFVRKLSEPALILAAGVVGIVLEGRVS
jgi:chromate transporter